MSPLRLCVSAVVFFSAASLVSAQEEEGKVTPGRERHSAVQIQLSGHLDPHFLYRDGAVNEAGGRLNGTMPDDSSTNLWAGRFKLRTDVFLKDNVTGVLELENRSFDEGINRPFSTNPRTDTVEIKQGYVDIAEFLALGLDLRVGVQSFALHTRAMDEPFFMDLGESEGFFAGFSSAGSEVRNTVDRRVQEATGARLYYALNEGMAVQGLWVVTGENGPTSSDESVYALFVNGTPSEMLSAWIMACLVSGGDPHLKEVWTLGAGADFFPVADKAFELFGEFYLQRGTLVDDPVNVRKKAWAMNGGGRYVAPCRAWAEAAFSLRSGDRHAGDDTDEAFQSYENENRFLILQSAEFGLDVDTNVRVLRAAAGSGPIKAGGRPLRLRLDVGRFTADQKIFGASGTVLTRGSERDWGVETDLNAAWNYNDSLTLWIQGAALWNSGILDDLTGDSATRSVVAGVDLKF